LILTGLILAYSMTVGSSNKKSAERLETLNTSIKRLSENPDIQAYQLYEQNKRKIDNMTYFSNIPLFYKEISDISSEFGIVMSEFSYSNKTVSIAASAVKNPLWDAYQKYEELISSYRWDDLELEEWEEPEQKMFDLEFVRSFNWANRIVSNLNFTVLEPLPEKIEVIEDDEVWNTESATWEILEQE